MEEVGTSGRTGMKTAVSAGMEVELSGAVFTCRLVVGGLVGGWQDRKGGWVMWDVGDDYCDGNRV